MLNSESMGWPLRGSWMLLIASQFLPVWYSGYALMLLLIVFILGWKTAEWRVPLQNNWFTALLAFFLWQVVSLSWTQNMVDAGSNLGTQLLLVLLPALFLTKRPSQMDSRWLFKTQLFASLAAVVAALLFASWRVYHSPVIDHTIYATYFFYTGLAEPIMHPGYFSLQLVVSLGILYKFWREGHWRVNIWTLSVGILFLLFLVMLNGRMTLFAAFLTLSFALLYQAISLRRWKPLLILVMSALLLIFSYPLFPVPLKQRLAEVTESTAYDLATFQTADYNGITIRLALWECATEVIKDNFWLGTGAGDGKDALRAVYEAKGFQTALEGQFNSHNQFVEAMLYGGLIQVLLLLGIFITGVRLAVKAKNMLFLAFLVFIFLCLQTETILFWHRGALFFGIFSTLFYLAQPTNAKETNIS